MGAQITDALGGFCREIRKELCEEDGTPSRAPSEVTSHQCCQMTADGNERKQKKLNQQKPRRPPMLKIDTRSPCSPKRTLSEESCCGQLDDAVLSPTKKLKLTEPGQRTTKRVPQSLRGLMLYPSSERGHS